MVWYLLSMGAFAVAISLLVVTRIRDRRFERLAASRTMRPEVMEELQEETSAAHARRERFRAAIQKATGPAENA